MPKHQKKQAVVDTNNCAGEYNWNIKARRIDALYEGRPTADDADHTIRWPDDDPPNDFETLSLAKVKKFKLNHGDVLRFGSEYTFRQSFFVYRTPKGQYKLIQNPDESEAGLLTVPRDVLQHVTDSLKKYKDILADDYVILHLSHDDKFVRNQLGENIPECWHIGVDYNRGKLEEVRIIQGDSTWDTKKWKGASVKQIKSFFSDTSNTSFTVKLSIRGNKFKEYKARYSSGKKSQKWMKAFAKLPNRWSLEQGKTWTGSTSFRSTWTCQGPTRFKDEVKDAINNFFAGFDVSTEEQIDC